MPQANAYPLRVDKGVMEKFKVVASANSRSVNKEIEMLMRSAVAVHEAAHGPIQSEDPAGYNE